MRFPEFKNDGDLFNYRGRVFRWIEKPSFEGGGMWCSEGSSHANDTTIEQSPLWKDVVEKPDPIMDLGWDWNIEGQEVTIRTRRLGEKPWFLENGELGVDLQERKLYMGVINGDVPIGGGNSGGGDGHANPVHISDYPPNPADTFEGDLWYCTGTNEGLYLFDGSIWFSTEVFPDHVAHHPKFLQE